MNSDPALFDSTMLETASEALLFCAESLQTREPITATQLAGFNPISTLAVGRIALGVLRSAYSTVRDNRDKRAVAMAFHALQRALQGPTRPELAAVA